MTILHEFYGTPDKHPERKAVVFKEEDGYSVLMIADKAIIEERKITGHSEQYAEDCAENWVLGVIR